MKLVLYKSYRTLYYVSNFLNFVYNQMKLVLYKSYRTLYYVSNF